MIKWKMEEKYIRRRTVLTVLATELLVLMYPSLALFYIFR